MKRFTVSISKELKDKLDKMPQINWSEVAKQGVVEMALKLDKLRQRGEL